MRLVRRITVVTANHGRGASPDEFRANVWRLHDRFDLSRTFFGKQEIDEDDKPDEMDFLKYVFKDTHRFVGVHTHVPILVPKTFSISAVEIDKASDGVAGLQPDRHVVDAIVFPSGLKTKRKLRLVNTHIGRDIPELQDERRESMRCLREHYDNDLATIATLDANTENLGPLERGEKKLASARVDYIRGIERGDVQIRILRRGTVPLVGDGHNAEYANLMITWP